MTLVCRHCEALNLDGATHCRACGGNFSLGGPRLATEIGRFWTRPIVLAAISCPISAPIVYWPLAFLVDPSGRSEVFGKVLITLGPVHNQTILVPSGLSQEARIDAKDATQ